MGGSAGQESAVRWYLIQHRSEAARIMVALLKNKKIAMAPAYLLEILDFLRSPIIYVTIHL